MQTDKVTGDPDLLALAHATDQLAETIANPTIAVRLREIAREVRAMAQRMELCQG